jgi:hypothetical protein
MVVVAGRGSPTQFDCGMAPRFDGRHAGAQILLGLKREMFGEFLLQALVRPLSR